MHPALTIFFAQRWKPKSLLYSELDRAIAAVCIGVAVVVAAEGIGSCVQAAETRAVVLVLTMSQVSEVGESDTLRVCRRRKLDNVMRPLDWR